MSRISRALPALAALSISALVSASPASAGGSWSLLDRGEVGIYSWRVEAKRQGGPARAGVQGRRPACVKVALKRQHGPFNYIRVRFRRCMDGAQSRHLSAEPLLTSAALAGPDGSPAFTAVGVLAPPRVRRLRVTLPDGRVRPIRLERSRGKTAGIGALSYAAFAVRGRWAPQRIVALSGFGRRLWDSASGAGGTMSPVSLD